MFQINFVLNKNLLILHLSRSFVHKAFLCSSCKAKLALS